jgi:hypothetical protein
VGTDMMYRGPSGGPCYQKYEDRFGPRVSDNRDSLDYGTNASPKSLNLMCPLGSKRKFYWKGKSKRTMGIKPQHGSNQKIGTNTHVGLDITVNETEFMARLNRQNHLSGRQTKDEEYDDEPPERERPNYGPQRRKTERSLLQIRLALSKD